MRSLPLRPVRPCTARLRVALARCGEAYRRWRVAAAGGIDTLVLTATNARQAEGYRAELEARRWAGAGTAAFFPEALDAYALADPVIADGRLRVGSGGATLAALRQLERRYGRDGLLSRSIVLIHSGGLSQRLPAYSPVGKVFSPLPLTRPDGQPGTLFDHLFVTAAAVVERLGPGLTVLAGDVFLVLDPLSIPRRTDSLPRLASEVPLAVGLWVEPTVGRQHGVYVPGAGGIVRQTLQKVTVAEMASAGALHHGRVLVDTGLLHFPPAVLATLLELARRPMRPPFVPLDLYETLVGAMTSSAAHAVAPALAALAAHPLHVCAPYGEFLHLGTTVQFRNALVGPQPSPAAALLRADVHASHAEPARGDRRVFAAVVVPRTRLGSGSVVEHSLLEAPDRGRHRVGRGSVVSQVRTGPVALDLPPQRLYFQCPLRPKSGRTVTAGYAHVVCHVRDDFKSGRFLGQPLARWLRRAGLSADDLWPAGSPQTLWTARLFPVTPLRQTCPEAVALACGRITTAWRRRERVAMADILERVSTDGLLTHREVLAAARLGADLAGRIRDGDPQPLEPLVPPFRSADAYQQLADVLETALVNPLHKARAHHLLSRLAQRPPARTLDAADHEDQAFAAVARAADALTDDGRLAGASVSARGVQRAVRRERRQRPLTSGRAECLPPGTRVVATAPVRIDLAGGWTDTPPYCFENGGHVVNLAVLLDDRPPVCVEVSRRAVGGIELVADDLGQRRSIGRAPERIDLDDPFALHLTALSMMGLADGRTGLCVKTCCRVPKGSGLGTSSILAATMLAALARFRGRSPSPGTLYDWTLRLEQRLSTGGGWQDQAGGVVGGIKSIRTRPGVPQRLRVRRLELDPPALTELASRLVIYFTGRQRLARDILRRVVGRYLAREPDAMHTLRLLADDAARLAASLANGSWRRVLPCVVERYWQCKTRLFPGSSNPAIDALFTEVARAFPGVAGGLAGAGGGGFAYFIAPDAAAAARLRSWLTRRGRVPGNLGVVYPATIAREGLCVRVDRPS